MASAVALSQTGFIPSGPELVARARAMIPALRARAAACVGQRDVPAASIAELQEAG